jgi:hypothetical protein
MPVVPHGRGSGRIMTRYTSDEATVWVWGLYDRTCLKWRSSDYWDEIRVSLKDYFPRHGDLSYSPTRKLWTVPAWRRPVLEEWLLWTFEPSCIRWDEEPPGPYGRTYHDSSYGRYSRPRTSTSTLEAAYRVLHLYPTAPPELAQAAHRIMVKLSHPDVGGSHEAAVAVNAAWEVIQAHQHAERKAS